MVRVTSKVRTLHKTAKKETSHKIDSEGFLNLKFLYQIKKKQKRN